MRKAVVWCAWLAVLAGCLLQVPTGSPPQNSPLDELTRVEAVTPDSAAVLADPPGESEPAPKPALEEPTGGGHNTLEREELEAGWIRLFDGHTLFGWQPNSDTRWQVQDGVISAEGETTGLLVTTTRFANYELRCDFRLEPGGNSGIFLRTPLKPANPAVDCYELNLWDAAPEYKTASLVGRAKPAEEVTLDGEWHNYLVRVDGPHVAAVLDGKPVLSYVDQTATPLATGFIGLQMNGGRVEFRNVFLRPLGLDPLFDGESLTGWRIVPGSEGQFEVTEHSIHITGGRGFLETERTAADFVLQFEAKTHGDGLNSGIFFRTQPGTKEAPSNGYEFQIHNGFRDGDRNVPVDHGSGAIFNRVKARRVVAHDHAWLTATLIADGPHFATWVDGIQMVDWTDGREPDDNPRKGLRLSPGHFSLQGHDPTSNLEFRNLRLADWPSR
jgi:hypothetical protein